MKFKYESYISRYVDVYSRRLNDDIYNDRDGSSVAIPYRTCNYFSQIFLYISLIRVDTL